MYIRQKSDPHKINYYWWYQNRRMPEAKCLWTHWDLVLLHDLGNGKEYPVRLWRCYTIFHKKLTPNFAARWHVNQKRRACHLPLKDLKTSRPGSPEISSPRYQVVSIYHHRQSNMRSEDKSHVGSCGHQRFAGFMWQIISSFESKFALVTGRHNRSKN